MPINDQLIIIHRSNHARGTTSPPGEADGAIAHWAERAEIMALQAIVLNDGNGKSARFEYGIRKADQQVFSKPAGRDRGFGEVHTDFAEVEQTSGKRFNISGDAWRFFEGTLGIKTLFETFAKDYGPQLVEDFLEQFDGTGNDNEAMKLWQSLESEAA